MKTKNILIAFILLVLVAGGAYWYISSQSVQLAPAPQPTGARPEDNMTTEKFSGKLEQVNVGCFVDAECYVVVSGKHVTLVMGWSQETVGSVQGVESIGDLEAHLGENMEVYAQKKSETTYTLYGSESFYIKLK